MSVDSGWIASYPYDPTDQEWYTSNHGWQWSSSYTFNGSYGNFDVSELYDNFFTTYQTPTGTSTTTTSDDNSATTNSSSSNVGVIEVNNSSSSYVPLMALQTDGSMKTITNRALSNNTSWQTDQTKVVDGTTYYRVATNEWVAEQYLANNSSTTNAASDANVIKVNNANSSYVQLVALQTDGSMKTITNRALANNTSWQTDQTKVVDGTTYYRVATNEWINAEYII